MQNAEHAGPQKRGFSRKLLQSAAYFPEALLSMATLVRSLFSDRVRTDQFLDEAESCCAKMPLAKAPG
jgi:hypothetical protein